MTVDLHIFKTYTKNRTHCWIQIQSGNKTNIVLFLFISLVSCIFSFPNKPMLLLRLSRMLGKYGGKYVSSLWDEENNNF